VNGPIPRNLLGEWSLFRFHQILLAFRDRLELENICNHRIVN